MSWNLEAVQAPEHAPSPSANDAATPEYDAVRVVDVEPESVRWLWSSRVPRGKLTVLDGDPGLGKSTIMLDIGARVSTGSPMPDGDRSLDGAAGVVLLTAEDGIADTIRPRLEAAHADLDRVSVLRSVHDNGRGLSALHPHGR